MEVDTTIKGLVGVLREQVWNERSDGWHADEPMWYWSNVGTREI